MIQDKYSDEIDKLLATFYQTAAARQARWPGSKAERWGKKRDRIILFIARIGWGTVELTNYFLRQSSRNWVKRMHEEGWLFLEKVIIGDKTVSRNKPNGKVASIILLSEQGQKHARGLDPRIGKRISRSNQQQSRHDLIAAWSAIFLINERSDLAFRSRKHLEIWSDQVLRGFKNEQNRPDISIIYNQENVDTPEIQIPQINIEVERRQKKIGWPEYEFLMKLENYRLDDVETLIVVETEARAKSLAELFFRSEKIGIQEYFFNDCNKKWWPKPVGFLKKFIVSAKIGVWDHSQKTFTDAFSHNLLNDDD